MKTATINTLLYPLQIFRTYFWLFSFSILLVACRKDFEEVNTTASSGSVDAAVTTKPNIVFIVADDIGYEIPTCNGGQSYKTPNIDLMAKNGMRFTQCQASPMCSPSRVMLMTGKYSFRNYITWEHLELNQKTIANMLQDGGYDTYAVGKWQFDGGDAAAHHFGFSDYTIIDPFKIKKGDGDDDNETHGRYKSPEIYSHGGYLPGASTRNKYCDDILVDSLKAYATRSASRKKPFFIYYATSLAHSPFSPTPDDPQFAAWDPNSKVSDTSFFDSMVKYLDKKIGQVLASIESLGQTENTIFIFTGDNGTPHNIYSMFKGQLMQGGKNKTILAGTHVPLIVYWKGKIAPNVVIDDMIDFTDFLPTIAGLARLPVPTTYGKLDGRSFLPRLRNQPGRPRDWTFCHFDAEHQVDKPAVRFIQNQTYKLYDTTDRFYNMILDPLEKNRIRTFTPEELALKEKFQNALNTLH